MKLLVPRGDENPTDVQGGPKVSVKLWVHETQGIFLFQYLKMS